MINLKKYAFFLIPMFITLTLAYYLSQNFQKPFYKISKQNSAINLEKDIFHFFNLGNKKLITNILWIQTLLESDLEHYQQKDLNSWMFLRFNSILSLDPYFLDAYKYGAVYLSIIKDDDLGAKIIYDKGLKYYPDNFYLNFNAGYHYFLELGNPRVAHKLFNKIKDYPEAPHYLPSLVARIQASLGDLHTAYLLVLGAYKRAPKGSHIYHKFHQSLYAIKAEIDLECLNSKKPSVYQCEIKDFDGNNYLRDSNNQYFTQKKWKAFRPSIPKQTSSSKN